MTHKRLFRSYHSFYTLIKSSLYKDNSEQSSLEKGVIHTKPPLNDAPDFKVKTGLGRFLDRYPDYREMFVGSMKFLKNNLKGGNKKT